MGDEKVDRGALKLYKFELYCGRMGSVSAIFVAGEDEVKRAIGRECYFGEILGKHSEISCTLAPEHFKVLTDSASFVEQFEAFGCASGHNPLHVLEDQDDG